MLKYYSIISQISQKDKIRLLTDISYLSSNEFHALGIPEIKIADVSEYCAEHFPSPISLSNSWDVELISEVAFNTYNNISRDGANLICVPSPKIKVDTYSPALSEDSFLASAISHEYVKATKKASTCVALSIGANTPTEAKWLNDTTNEEFIQERVYNPYRNAINGTDCQAIIVESDFLSSHYKNISSLYTDNAENNTTLLCANASKDITVLHIANGGLCIKGSASALESALGRYEHLKKAIELGHSTTEDLKAELSMGKAISPDTIDQAIDRLINFAFSVKRSPQLVSEQDITPLSVKACEASTVLLKNKGSILPLKQDSTMCILGDIVADDKFTNELTKELQACGYKFIGFERGYDINSDRSEDLLDSALSLARKSDIVITFLGLGKSREKDTAITQKIAIPANQQHLLDRLSVFCDKVVAILPPDHTPDIGLPQSCSAILLTPFYVISDAKALANILTGKVSPCGRLSSTVYTDTREQILFKELRERNKTKNKEFIGYKHYETTNEYQQFPFGHGLSYANFSYSDLRVTKNSVKFSVKNNSNIQASEIAQLYIGTKDHTNLMPLKELCGFAKIDLAPGEKRLVEFILNTQAVAKLAQHHTTRIVYVGSSSADIKLTKKIRAVNFNVTHRTSKHLDYIQAQSNIITDNFKLEEKNSTMKKSVFNFISGSVSILLAIALKLYCISVGIDSVFFDCFVIALVLFGLILFISEVIRRNNIHKAHRQEIDKANAKNFKNAQKISQYDAKAMFINEFDIDNDSSSAQARNDDAASKHLDFVDREQSFANAVADFEIFAQSKGYKFTQPVIKKIFSAISASRLIIVTGMNDEDFKSFMTVLSNYFETEVFIDRIDPTYISAEDLLFKADSDSSSIKHKTQTCLAIESAANVSHHIHFAGLTNIQSAGLSSYFSQYASYAKDPYGNHRISASNENNLAISYYVPQNLWFVLNLAEAETPKALPAFVSEIATVNAFPFMQTVPTVTDHAIKKFTYYQLEYLYEKAENKFFISEANWKKVDKLERTILDVADFKITNKMWLALERYTSAYVSAGGEENSALDEAIAAKLIVPIISVCLTAPNNSNTHIIETLKAIFSDVNVSSCLKMITYCGRQ